MASALKRKRGPVEILETPKRAKSVKSSQESLPTPKLSQETGWEATFKTPTKTKELVHTNGINGDGINGQRDSNSVEAIDFEDFVENERKQKDEQTRLKKEEKALKRAVTRKPEEVWKVSESIGGRMIDVDPVFTRDEKFLIVANRTTVQVYSTSNSLLTRTIKLQIDASKGPNARIITYCLSPTDSDFVWVACADGTIYRINWTNGAGTDQSWTISSTGCIHMTVASMDSAGRRRDVVFTTEIRKDGGWRITANELAPPGGPIETAAKTIYTSTQRINFMKTAKGGTVIVAASGNRVLLGSLRSTEFGTIDKIKYEFRVFESTDAISSLDIKTSDREKAPVVKGQTLKGFPIVDVVVGDVKGSIFVHNDLLQNLYMSQRGGQEAPGICLIPRKLHWHRQTVYTVKWSLDGNYIISGGTETVLVLWQLDTGKQQFLPHMSATIQNVVVSPTGSSYAVQLADNSTMVLSTAELKPTANISGVQTCVLDYDQSIASSVRRVQEEAHEFPIFQHTPAAINPVNPSQLLLGVGQTYGVDPNNPLVTSVPLLQIFDIGSARNLSRQALTRTNITNTNITPNAHKVSEPRTTHMKISSDGSWLATIDEWIPPKQDFGFLGYESNDSEAERRKRREVFLKFWQQNKDNDTWELVSRIDAPHASSDGVGVGSVFDLATDPSSTFFATIGEDGVVRTWSTKTRKRDGVIVRGQSGIELKNWICYRAISISKPELLSDSDKAQKGLSNGCIAFSEDGSILAAAYGGNGVLHLLDPASGTLRVSLDRMFEGNILKAEFLGQDLITLSDRLLVYDLVLDEMRYSIKLGPSVTSLSLAQKLEMMLLAVDRRSRTFAVTLPARFDGPAVADPRKQSLLTQYSELAVFNTDKRAPLIREAFSTLVTALLPAVSSDGYLVLNSAAEIRTVLKNGTQAITNLAQSTSALQLDTVEEPEEQVFDLMELVEEEAEETEEIQLPGLEANDDDDETEFPVVRQQQLSEIFDIGPAFALPPMEEMFYQVAGLFVSKPQSV